MPSPITPPRLRFEPNVGQFDARTRYLARGSGFALQLTSERAEIALRLSAPLAAPLVNGEELVSVRLVGARATEPVGSDPLPGKSNYFVGQDVQRWKTGVESFARVRYRDVLPGVDIVYYGTERGELEYDLLLAPGVAPDGVELAFAGVDAITIDQRGDALLRLPSGAILRERAPVAYQIDSQGRHVLVPARFEASGQHGLGFVIGPHDATRPLVIDPVLSYSSYIGASNFDQLSAVATDSAGNTYAVGYTSAGLFPTTAPLQPAFKGGGSDAVICKLNPAGTEYVYATYLGGTSADQAYAVAADTAGNAYVTGVTYSANFPVSNAFQTTLTGAGTADAFVVKLNAAGSALLYSTYLGGAGDDFPAAIAVTAAGSARVVGQTFSNTFPLVAPVQPAFGGDSDAFLTGFTPAGSSLEFSTFLGGNRADYATGIAIAPSGQLVLTGWTKSTNFPTVAPFQATFGGATDAFLTRLNASGSSFVSSSYLGGTGADLAAGVALQSGSAVVVGSTNSSDFPTVAAAQSTLGSPGLTDAFVTRFTNDAAGLIFSTYLGGAGDDAAASVAADADNGYVVGRTASAALPVVAPLPGHTALAGASDALLAAYTPSGVVGYLSYLGGNNQDYATGIALRAGQAHIVGNTFSSDFPVVGAPPGFDMLHGSQDGFIARSPLMINRIAASATSSATVALLGVVLLAAACFALARRRQPPRHRVAS